MQPYALTVDKFLDHAAKWSGDREIVTADAGRPALRIGYAALRARSNHLSGRNIAGAQLAWQHARFLTTLYGTNLTNQHYVAALNSGLNFAGFPRQYGLRFLTSF